MKSKEALEEWYKTMSVNDKIRWENNYLSIKNDLEILEILKEHYDVNFLEVSPNYFAGYSIYEDNKDFKKVKEWLNNDSNKRIY